MIANVLIVVSFFALAAWIFRKYAMRQDDMGKKEDDDTFESQQRGSWFDVGDDQSFRRRMLYPFACPPWLYPHIFSGMQWSIYCLQQKLSCNTVRMEFRSSPPCCRFQFLSNSRCSLTSPVSLSCLMHVPCNSSTNLRPNIIISTSLPVLKNQR